MARRTQKTGEKVRNLHSFKRIRVDASALTICSSLNQFKTLVQLCSDARLDVERVEVFVHDAQQTRERRRSIGTLTILRTIDDLVNRKLCVLVFDGSKLNRLIGLCRSTIGLSRDR